MSHRWSATATRPGNPDPGGDVFKRRTSRGPIRILVEAIYPRGGWRRAFAYMLHRMRRLPDSPERICIGIAAGVYVSFLPLYGFHFVSAALVAWLCRGNILAALLGTFYGNPITFPLMAVGSIELGHWLLQADVSLRFAEVTSAIGWAGSELLQNLWAVLAGEPAQWGRLRVFWWNVYLPYLLGGLILGVPAAIATYFIHLPLVRAYQRRRYNRLRQRFEQARQRAQQTKDQP